jgi:hypothetical protein
LRSIALVDNAGKTLDNVRFEVRGLRRVRGTASPKQMQPQMNVGSVNPSPP